MLTGDRELNRQELNHQMHFLVVFNGYFQFEMASSGLQQT